jgi:positive regulator of sigma E activity
MKQETRKAAKEQSSVEINDANSFLASSVLNYMAFLFTFLNPLLFLSLFTLHLYILTFSILVAFLITLLELYSFPTRLADVT